MNLSIVWPQVSPPILGWGETSLKVGLDPSFEGGPAICRDVTSRIDAMVCSRLTRAEYVGNFGVSRNQLSWRLGTVSPDYIYGPKASRAARVGEASGSRDLECFSIVGGSAVSSETLSPTGMAFEGYNTESYAYVPGSQEALLEVAWSSGFVPSPEGLRNTDGFPVESLSVASGALEGDTEIEVTAEDVSGTFSSRWGVLIGGKPYRVSLDAEFALNKATLNLASPLLSSAAAGDTATPSVSYMPGDIEDVFLDGVVVAFMQRTSRGATVFKELEGDGFRAKYRDIGEWQKDAKERLSGWSQC